MSLLWSLNFYLDLCAMKMSFRWNLSRG